VIVVDASVAVLGLLADGDARRFLATEQLLAPHLIDAEVVNAIRRQTKSGRVDAEVGRTVIGQWARLAIERITITGLLDRVWALRDNLSAYDASYVAMAEALRCPLVTADGRLGRAPGPRCAITVLRS
jgi:predicted nucleic acid-binding protein